MRDSPFKPICDAWLRKLRCAQEHKKKVFGKDAEDAMRFYNGPYNFLYENKDAFFVSSERSTPRPTFRVSLNKVAELVQLFGPVLYHNNPVRKVTPRKSQPTSPYVFGDPNDPRPVGPLQMMPDGTMQPLTMGMVVQQQHQQFEQMGNYGREIDAERGRLYERYLGQTPNQLNLKTHARRMIDEALIKGRGILMPELYIPPNQNFRMAGSFFISVDYQQIDPDCECVDDAMWMAFECWAPKWRLAREYGIPEEELKSTAESSERSMEEGNDRNKDEPSDLVRYWKIYSKMGIGGRFSGMEHNTELAALDQFGDYCYLVIAEGVNYPLNFNPWKIAKASEDEVMGFLQWPTPFWLDDAWPCAILDFHEVPRSPWPMSHIKPALGELKFMNWLASFILGKISVTCRDRIVIPKGLEDEAKSALTSGEDFAVVEIQRDHPEMWKDIVAFIQHPDFKADIWKVLEFVSDMFDKRTGMTELIYGMSARQMRSAQEAAVKADAMSVRPEDMANKVEDAMSDAATKELIVMRFHLEPPDIAAMLDQQAAFLWERLVMTSDPLATIHQFDARVEAGSARKPNRDRDAANLQNAMQVLLAPLFQYAMTTGDLQPVNALILDWAKSIEMGDPERYLLRSPPPPPPDDEIAAQQGQQEMQLEQARFQLESQSKQQDLAIAGAKANQELRQDQAAHKQEMTQTKEKGALDLKLQRQKAAAQRSAIEKNGSAK